jgi:hypothetical protein
MFLAMTQNDFVNISSAVSAVSVLTVFVLARRKRGKKRILITDYRRGVRFVGGVFVDVLGAGSHTYDPRKEQVTIVDMRPQPIVIERLVFQDALRHQGLISLGAELLVRDPHLAATALRDQVKDSYILARDTVRNAISQQIVSGRDSLGAVSEAITKAVRAELGKVGMGISEIEITELWSSSNTAPQQTSSGSMVVQ